MVRKLDYYILLGLNRKEVKIMKISKEKRIPLRLNKTITII